MEENKTKEEGEVEAGDELVVYELGYHMVPTLSSLEVEKEQTELSRQYDTKRKRLV